MEKKKTLVNNHKIKTIKFNKTITKIRKNIKLPFFISKELYKLQIWDKCNVKKGGVFYFSSDIQFLFNNS